MWWFLVRPAVEKYAALLRANLLSPGHSESGKTLLLTFSNPLVKYLRHLAGDDLPNVVIETFHTFARGNLARYGHRVNILELF